MQGGAHWRLPAAEGKALADFVAGAGGTKKAFVEKKLAGDKVGEVGRAADSGFEIAKIMMAFAARQSDMRLEGASLGNEAAGQGGRGDTFLKWIV